jgi:hypothetical protein
LQKKQRFEKTSLTWENGHAVHAVGVADPFLLIPCKSLLKKQGFEKTSLTWENGHAVHAVGVADPFLKKIRIILFETAIPECVLTYWE